MATTIRHITPTFHEKQQIRGLLDEIIREPDMMNQYSFMEKAAL